VPIDTLEPVITIAWNAHGEQAARNPVIVQALCFRAGMCLAALLSAETVPLRTRRTFLHRSRLQHISYSPIVNSNFPLDLPIARNAVRGPPIRVLVNPQLDVNRCLTSDNLELSSSRRYRALKAERQLYHRPLQGFHALSLLAI
jgi:hypothetical protein